MFLPARLPRLGSGRLVATLTTFALVAMSGQAARADLMKFNFTGTLTNADPSTGAAPGTAFSGSFAYNPTTAVAGPTSPGTAQYLSGATLLTPLSIADGSDLNVSVAGKSIYSNPNGMNLTLSQFDYAGQYGYAPGPRTTLAITNVGVDHAPVLVSLELTNGYKALYPNLSVPGKLNLADFGSAILSIYDYTGGVESSLLYRGNLDNLNIVPTPAPEPATVVILGVAVAGWFVRSRRRSA